jgi:hypothetical protein
MPIHPFRFNQSTYTAPYDDGKVSQEILPLGNSLVTPVPVLVDDELEAEAEAAATVTDVEVVVGAAEVVVGATETVELVDFWKNCPASTVEEAVVVWDEVADEVVVGEADSLTRT